MSSVVLVYALLFGAPFIAQVRHWAANGSGLSATSSATILRNGDIGSPALLSVQASGVFAGNLAAQTITALSSVVSPTFNASGALGLNGANINTCSTLSDVAYFDQSQTFMVLNHLCHRTTRRATHTCDQRHNLFAGYVRVASVLGVPNGEFSFIAMPHNATMRSSRMWG